jgi:hypothetical protein
MPSCALLVTFAPMDHCRTAAGPRARLQTKHQSMPLAKGGSGNMNPCCSIQASASETRHDLQRQSQLVLLEQRGGLGDAGRRALHLDRDLRFQRRLPGAQCLALGAMSE